MLAPEENEKEAEENEEVTEEETEENEETTEEVSDIDDESHSNGDVMMESNPEPDEENRRYPVRIRNPKVFPDFVNYLCKDKEPITYEEAISPNHKN